MKKSLILILIFALAFCVSVTAFEDGTEDRLMASGVCGGLNEYDGSIIWNLYESGRCVIEGYGVIYDKYNTYNNYCSICNSYWNHSSIWSGHYNSEYASRDEYIDPYWPEDFSNKIKSIEFTGDISHINYGAFSYLLALEEIILPENITTLETDLFCGCTALKSIVIPENITAIAEDVFFGCSSLETVTIPKNVSSISASAFSGCTSLKIEISEDNPYFTVENGIILNKEKTEIVYIPASAAGTFTIPDGITAISDGLFKDNKSITKIIIPENVTEIGSYAFAGCSNLSEINLPESIVSIGSYAFKDCTSLKSIEIPDGITHLEATFDDCLALEKITLPEGLKTMWGAFRGCVSIEKIELPASLVSIDSAFEGCTALKSIEIPLKVTSISSAFNGCASLEKVILPENIKTIGYSAFSGCVSLGNIDIPTGVLTIESGAFEGCASLTSVALPEGILTLEGSVFSGCKLIEKIVIPSGITSIDYSTFSDCTSLKEIVFPDNLKSIGGSAFSNCTALAEMNFPESLTNIHSSAFDNVPLFNPDNITEDYYVSGWLVKKCKTDETEYTIKSGLKVMAGAFNNSGITDIFFENGIIAISEYLFFDNKELQRIVLPVTLKEIGDCAFSGCDLLESVEFEERYEIHHESGEYVKLEPELERIGYDAFYNCSLLTGFDFGHCIKEIGSHAFFGCVGINELYIPKSMSYIGNYAFAGCTGLETVFIMPEVSSWYAENMLYAEYNAFDGYINTLYLGVNTYDCSSSIGLYAYNVYYLNGCEYDAENHILTGSSVEICACKNNPDSFLKKIYTIKIEDGTTVLSACDYGYNNYGFINLRSFILPDSLERIEEDGLLGLTNIRIFIPKNVNYIHPLCGWNSFLDGIDVSAENEYYSSDAEGMEVYSKDGTVLYRTLRGGSEYIVSENIKHIYDFALESYGEIVIHNGIESIGWYVFQGSPDVYYAGTENEWNNIRFADETGAYYVHFGYGKKMTKTSCEIAYSDNYTNRFYKLTVTFPEIEIKDNSIVFAIGVNDEGVSTLSTKTLTAVDSSAVLVLPNDTLDIKIFVWESLDNLIPLSEVEKISVRYNTY